MPPALRPRDLLAAGLVLGSILAGAARAEVLGVDGAGAAAAAALRAPPQVLGFPDIDPDALPPFRNFAWAGPGGWRLTGSRGMALWTQRVLEARARDALDPAPIVPLSEAAAPASVGPSWNRPANPGIRLVASELRRIILRGTLEGVLDFHWYRDMEDLQDALLRRLEAGGGRALTVALRSLHGTRVRHLLVYRGEQGGDGAWRCRFYDPHLPVDHPQRLAGELRLRGAGVEVRRSWAEVASHPDLTEYSPEERAEDRRGAAEDDPFAPRGAEEWLPLASYQVGLAVPVEASHWDAAGGPGRVDLDATQGDFAEGVFDSVPDHTPHPGL